MHPFVQHEVSGELAVIRLNRPERRNALTPAVIDQLLGALNHADQDDAVRAVILTAVGSTFCAGVDISGGAAGVAAMTGAADRPAQPPRDYRDGPGRLSLRLHRMNKPVIAAVNGDAIGGGATLLTAMDAILAVETARFGFVFTRRGMTPEGTSSWSLPRLVGVGRALDWLMSGRLVTAHEAREAGFVHHLSSADTLLPHAMDLAQRLVDGTSPTAVALTRRLVRNATLLTDPQEASDVEAKLLWHRSAAPDVHEGIASFLDRRAPEFSEPVGEQVGRWFP